MSRSGEAESFVELAQQVAKALGRDETRKRRVAANMAQLGFAMDAAQISEMSSRELAGHVLKELGLKIGSDADPIQALDFYLAGRRHRAQLDAGAKLSALDGADSNSFVDHYLSEAQ